MHPAAIHVLENSLRLKNRLLGVGWNADPGRHFGPGGIDEAEALCRDAGADFLGFVRPPERPELRGLEVRRARRGALDGWPAEIRFDSPMPSGHTANDRVVARVVGPRRPRGDRKAIVFHHALLQKYWRLWEWFVAPLATRFPVVILAAPYHFDRIPTGWFPGEGFINPNPWRLFQAIRQWCWDQRALMNALPEALGLEPAAIVGFSLGAFQSILVAAAGDLDGLPLVSVAATNRYAHGLRHGVLGRGTLEGLERAGIAGDKLDRMIDAIQLDRYAPKLRGRRVLFIAGRHDLVDPPPSAERLEAALEPTRSVWLDSGHGTVLLERRRIGREVLGFLEDPTAK